MSSRRLLKLQVLPDNYILKPFVLDTSRMDKRRICDLRYLQESLSYFAINLETWEYGQNFKFKRVLFCLSRKAMHETIQMCHFTDKGTLWTFLYPWNDTNDQTTYTITIFTLYLNQQLLHVNNFPGKLELHQPFLQEAATTGCSRLDFHVVEWNKATAFYEKKGAVNLTKKEQWCYFRLSGEALKRFAEEITCIPKK